MWFPEISFKDQSENNTCIKQHQFNKTVTIWAVWDFSVMCFLQVWSDHACEEPTRPLLRSWPFWTATVRSTLTGCSLWYRESRRYNRTCSHTHLIGHLNACCTYLHAQPHAYAWRRNSYFLLCGRFIDCDAICWHCVLLNKHSICSAKIQVRLYQMSHAALPQLEKVWWAFSSSVCFPLCPLHEIASYSSLKLCYI